MSARARHKDQVEANATEQKEQQQREPRPMNGLGFFVARETATVYHPIASAKDWDYDAKNRVYDPGRDRARIETVIADNAAYLKWLGKKNRKQQARRTEPVGAR